MAKWIWKFGDFEKYHNMQLHGKRSNYGYTEPVVWKLYPPEPAVRFQKMVQTAGGKIHIRALGDASVSLYGNWDGTVGEKKCWGAEEIELPAGSYVMIIRVMNTQIFPAILVDGAICSDETWMVDDLTGNFAAVGTSALFSGEGAADLRPDLFPFQYESVEPVSVCKAKATDGTCGVLYDFGQEIFARIRIYGLKEQKVPVIYGESEEEALDSEWGYTRFCDTPAGGKLHYPAYACRYLFVGDADAEIEAETEMLPLQQRGYFRCNDEVVNRVYEVAVRTFHLNSREFYLDGIKRDRWVWSADAYQSFFVNHYLYLDQETEKRTLTALGGGLPVVQYINTIMDYSYFWLIALWDYYKEYGDTAFLKQIYPQAKAVMEFCMGRRSEDGFIRGGQFDWVFIDWAPMDKEGALLGEQILLAAAMEAFGRLLEVAETKEEISRYDYAKEAEKLRDKIMEKFYDREREVFIDSYESGKQNVTKQNNLLAYLFLHLDRKKRAAIYRNVVCNEKIEPITTPYFKFYENQVICEEGDRKRLEEGIRSYYGGMIAEGATTIWEQYDPTQSGAEHYAMYGRPYEKSLCHAWGCSPVYLLGRYRMGVRNTGIACDSFEVKPVLGDLEWFEGEVPLPQGIVKVKADRKKVEVYTTAEGGTLVIGERRYPLTAGEKMEIVIREG